MWVDKYLAILSQLPLVYTFEVTFTHTMSCLGETSLSHTSDSASQPSPLAGPGCPTREDWLAYREFIIGLYRNSDQSLKQIQAHLKECYNFNAT